MHIRMCLTLYISGSLLAGRFRPSSPRAFSDGFVRVPPSNLCSSQHIRLSTLATLLRPAKPTFNALHLIQPLPAVEVPVQLSVEPSLAPGESLPFSVLVIRAALLQDEDLYRLLMNCTR